MSRRPETAREAPIQAVESPILCGPYAEPTAHWLYDQTTGEAHREDGRRPASYFDPRYRQADQQLRLGQFAEETRNELALVNRLRLDVKRWREGGYRGASPVTKDLLAHWMRADAERRLFYCQREAVETVIFLLELVLPGRRPQFNLQVTDADLAQLADGDLLRLGCKMATGAGKTVVMAMLITWSLLNHLRLPSDKRFAGAVLACCPNLTIKERLQVLRPESEQSYYDHFRLIPTKLPALPPGRVLVTNWHQFQPEGEHVEGGASYRVVNKGEESPEAFARRILGNLADHAPLLVLNDEGHHAWRPNPEPDFLPPVDGSTPPPPEAQLVAVEDVEKEAEEATVWVSSLDRFAQGGGSPRLHM
ncbi:MAG: DEAD/DEAH box helicase family protein [Armatimonadetes bacterium]|nr:DEAD/DEAH box helicase family protein [Armatimonadota bacterium]